MSMLRMQLATLVAVVLLLVGQLSQLVADLNSISAKEVREFDEKLRLDPSLYRLQHEDGAEVGRHFGLMVASIKSKERAQAKINTDYQQDHDYYNNNDYHNDDY
ncbi:hypothetical protein AK812_SmicGene3184 [Symbiodinium microadriaticum]|uniref:Uncharacterized protein n=1 Tax=Symbiodinium microadriaticum TaxID=2951 RepID=A0A1Q9EZJ1_SYMMI|nr:hypothetical protein AK812_SmicGene3184 [Symbiodinium microadriaticum]